MRSPVGGVSVVYCNARRGRAPHFTRAGVRQRMGILVKLGIEKYFQHFFRKA
jgi:hypothetical protein